MSSNTNTKKRQSKMHRKWRYRSKIGNSNKISDEELFQPPPNEDCPICLLQLPSHVPGSIYMSCCGKFLCSGCCHAPVFDNLGNVLRRKKCPFCRTPLFTSNEESIGRSKKREELNDAQGIYNLGGCYLEGLYGLQQDYRKAIELFVRAGELGCAKAFHNIGYAYDNGIGVERDTKKGTDNYNLAAIGGHVHARYNLALREDRAGNTDRALKHHIIAAGSGESNSLKEIQSLYTNGHATKEDYTKALRAYQAYLIEIKSEQRDAAAAFSDRFRYY